MKELKILIICALGSDRIGCIYIYIYNKEKKNYQRTLFFDLR
jgi:hypothetical protein